MTVGLGHLKCVAAAAGFNIAMSAASPARDKHDTFLGDKFMAEALTILAEGLE